MRTLHAYLMRQVLATLLMTVMVFACVLLLGNVLKEIMLLLVSQQVSLWLVARAVALLVPYVLVFALPMGLLTAALLVFGRFSADQELTAVRAGGVSLLAVSTPVFLLALLLSAFCAWINFEIAPKSRVAYKQLIFQIGLERPAGLLHEGQYVRDIPGSDGTSYTIYVKKINDEQLQEVKLYQSDTTGRQELWLHAPSGRLSFNPETEILTLSLFQAYGATRQDGEIRSAPPVGEATFELATRMPAGKDYTPKLNEMTFVQLREKLREIEALFQSGGGANPETSADLSRMKEDSLTPIRVQLHRQTAFSFACLGFTLVGVPLGIRAHRRETMIGVAVALLLVLVYYGFIIVGQALDTRPEWRPHLIVWLPNFLFQLAGGWLLWRVNSKV